MQDATEITVKEGRKKDTTVRVWERDTSGFLLFGGHDDWLNVGNEKTNVCCHCLPQDFEGNEDNTLTDKGENAKCTNTRLVAAPRITELFPVLFQPSFEECRHWKSKQNRTHSDIERVEGSAGALSKAVLVVDAKADTTPSKLCTMDS